MTKKCQTNLKTVYLNFFTLLITLNINMFIGGFIYANPIQDSVSNDTVQNKQMVNWITEDPKTYVRYSQPGVYIQEISGVPGNESQMTIRGLHSFLLNQDPLILVDGIPLTHSSDLDFNDILSFRILKNKSECAIYGSKGANGVLIIETKKGIQGKKQIKVNSTYGIQSIPDPIQMMNGNQSFQYIEDLNSNLIGTPQDKSVFWSQNYFYSDSMINRNQLQNIDWQNELFRMAKMQKQSIELNGFGKDIKYRVASSYIDQQGIVKNSDIKKLTFSANLTTQLREKLYLEGGAYFTHSSHSIVNTMSNSASEGNVILSTLAALPFLPAKDSLGRYFINPLNPMIDNTNAILNGNQNTLSRNVLLTRLSLVYDLTSFLKINLSGYSNIHFNRQNTFLSTQDVYLGRINKGISSNFGSEYYNNRYNASLDFNKSFTDNSLKIKVGYEIINARNSWNSSTGKGYSNDDIKEFDEASAITSSSNFHVFDEKAIISSLQYSFLEKLNVDLTYRLDASSRFLDDISIKSDKLRPDQWGTDKKEKWFSYYGIGLSYDLAKESFFQPNNLINQFKIGLSYSETGNIGGWKVGNTYPQYGNFSYSLINPDEDYTKQLFGSYGFNINNIYGLVPELTNEINISTDLSFFNNRVALSANYFIATTSNLVLPSSIDSSYQNHGELSTRGIELGFTLTPVNTNDITWLIGLNLTTSSNEVTKTNDLNQDFFLGYNQSNIISKGSPLFSFWGYKTEGVFDNQTEIDESPIQNGSNIGSIKYKNRDGNNIIDENDRYELGNPIPDFTLSLYNSLVFHNFDLSFHIYGAFGHEILNATRIQTEGLNDWTNQSADVVNRFPASNIAYPTTGLNNSLISDRFIEDATFIKLQDLSIGYSIPLKNLTRLGFSKLRLYVQSRNLLTISNYKGYNSELSSFGHYNIDLGTYPHSQYFGGGINLTFN